MLCAFVIAQLLLMQVNGSNGNQQSTAPALIILGWIVSCIFFLIGFYHTGKGLSEYSVFGWEYGSFILSFGILALLVIAYAKAVKGSGVALGCYILFAFINVICNINSFYPNYMGEKLIREELTQKHELLTQLTEDIKANFKDQQNEAFIEEIKKMNSELQAQIRDRGFSEKSNKDLDRISEKLETKFTRLTRGNTPEDWNTRAVIYDSLIKQALMQKLKQISYIDNSVLIKDAESAFSQYDPLIKNALDSIKPLERSMALIKDVVMSYNVLLKRAQDLPNNGNKDFKQVQQAKFDNEELGRFTHTYASIMRHLDEFGTWLIICVCLVIDFIIPLAMYFLIRRQKNEAPPGYIPILERKPKKPRRLYSEM